MAICEKCGREIPEGSVCECENEICDALTPADDNNMNENTAGSSISLAKESDTENVSAESSVTEATAEEAVSETSTVSEEVQADSAELEIKEEAAETAEAPAAEVKEAPAPEVKETPAAQEAPVKSAEPEVKEEKKETVKAETAEQTSVTPAPEAGAPAQKKGFIKKNLKVIIPVAAALAAVIGITGYVSANAYKKPINQFSKGFNSNKVEVMLGSMLPNDAVKDLKKELKDEDTSWKDLIKEMNDELKESKEDEFGRNANMEITFVNKYKATKDEINKNRLLYRSMTDEDIDKAYRVKIRSTIKGKDDSESERQELYVVHFEKSGWKLSTYSNGLDDGLGELTSIISALRYYN